MHFLPVLGACLLSLDMILLLKKRIHGEFIPYYEWLLRSSQLSVWVSFLIINCWLCGYELDKESLLFLSRSLTLCFTIMQTMTIIFSRSACSDKIFFNRILCLWWLLKPFFGIFHLQTVFSTHEVYFLFLFHEFVRDYCIVAQLDCHNLRFHLRNGKLERLTGDKIL